MLVEDHSVSHAALLVKLEASPAASRTAVVYIENKL